MKKKIKLCFFGAGNIIEEHIKAFSLQKNIELYSILSRTKSKSLALQKKYHIKNVYSNFSELKNNKEKKIAIVGVSILSTFSVCKKIFDYFDYCLIEKPLGYDFKEAVKINKLAKQFNVKVFAAFNRRSFQSTIQLKSIIKNIKSKRVVNIIDHEDNKFRKIKTPKKILDNWMFANSIHLIDYLFIFCRGKIISIKNQGLPNSLDRLSVIKFSSGDIGIYQGIWNCPGPWGVSVSTKDKYFKLQPLEVLSFRSTENYKMFEIKNNEKNNFKPGFVEQARNFILAVNGKKHGLPDIDHSLKTMKLIKNIYEK